MNLGEIHAFLAVGESGSINRAARRLRLSQPAVTRRVQRLEGELGVALLDRRAKPPALTVAGTVALQQCRNVLEAVEALRVAASASDGLPGELRLGVAHSLTDVALAGPLDQLRRVFPRLGLRLTTGWSQTLLEQVRQDALDMAIVQCPGGSAPEAALHGQLVATQPLVFVAPRRRRFGPTVTLAELEHERWVLNPDGCGGRAGLAQAFRRINAPLRVAVEAYGLDLQLSLVARGVGLGVVPPRVLARSPRRAQVRAFRIRGLDFRVGTWTVLRRSAVGLAPVALTLNTRLAEALS